MATRYDHVEIRDLTGLLLWIGPTVNAALQYVARRHPRWTAGQFVAMHDRGARSLTLYDSRHIACAIVSWREPQREEPAP